MLFWGLTKIPNLTLQPNVETYMGFNVNGKKVYGKRIELETATNMGWGGSYIIQLGVLEVLSYDVLYNVPQSSNQDLRNNWYALPYFIETNTSKRLLLNLTSGGQLCIDGSENGVTANMKLKGYVLYTKVND